MRWEGETSVSGEHGSGRVDGDVRTHGSHAIVRYWIWYRCAIVCLRKLAAAGGRICRAAENFAT